MLFQSQVDRLAQALRRRARARRNAVSRKLANDGKHPQKRSPSVEAMEPRLLMAADPIQVGAVYIEEDLGSDVQGDSFHITFQGGAAGTELTQLVIDGDLNSDGFSLGDLFFDTADSGLGADQSFAFQIDELRTANPNATVEATVVDGSTRLVLDFTNFVAGDSLIFSIDVDEVQFYDPNETDLDVLNDNFDPITSGVEFQNSHLEASFRAPHYEDVEGADRFRNRYDDWIDETGIALPRDDEGGKRDRTAGAGFELVQQPKPVSLSGSVYVDANEDLTLQSTEQRLENVQLELFVLDGTSFVSTGHTTQTDAQGRYSFGTDLALQPGIYQVRESQPSGFYSVGATIGLLNGQSVGETVTGNPDILTQIDLSKGDSHATDLNFAENLPSSISGHVCVVTGGTDCFDANSEKAPLAGVLIELRDASGAIVDSTTTAADGSYSFTNLRAGTYSITEVTPNGLLEGSSRAGSAGGSSIDPNQISQVVIGGGVSAIDYDFCEIEPSSISGHTYYDQNNNGTRDSGETPLANVPVTLWDDQGNVVAQTQTDSNGFYEFTNLQPGVYRLTEVTPADYIPGQAAVGTIDGLPSGRTDATGDVIDLISLEAGATGINYDFGEILTASISGRVFADQDGDCRFDPGETGLNGVTIELLDQNGNVLRTTLTDSNGNYTFGDLEPGVYGVRELQPDGYFHGGQTAGTGGGDDSVADRITAIDLSLGGDVLDYDFCELEPGSISGSVFADLDFDCFQDANETSLSNVRVELLNASGTVVQSTTTDSNGNYTFSNLRPGDYSVREIQPDGFFHGGQTAPSTGGDASADDLIASITVGPGADIVDADFCEVPPAEISGFVFQDGGVIVNDTGEVPEDLRSIRDGQRTTDDRPIEGVTVQLRTLTGEQIENSRALRGIYAGSFIEVETDANGFFSFTGIRAGSYHIYEQQPEGFEDGIDTVGTTTGFAVNRDTSETIPNSVTRLILLSNPPGNDAILAVAVEPGGVSRENNFSEVLAESRPPVPPIPPDPPRIPPSTYTPPPVIPAAAPVQALPQPAWSPLPLYIGVGHNASPTWHLSVINGGFPRGAANGEAVSEEGIRQRAERLNVANWTVDGMRVGTRLVSTDRPESAPSEIAVFDVPGAKPLAGDFNGDNYDELALFIDGEWFIDFNGNGRWDESDIWIRLGTYGDQPVVGDWDGDGKDDVGIFGQKWEGDERALAAETGLPDPENLTRIKPKNVPPTAEEAPNTPRILKRSIEGEGRADLIDHVFKFGGGRDYAVSGDFNGDGITNIGTFRDGRWLLDIDGDGKLTERDRQEIFGQPGDIPIVGDFDGDGIEEIGIVRGNRVIVDSDGDGEISEQDRFFLLDSANGSVIVGDFDGDGKDEPALHQSAAQRRSSQLRADAG